MGKKDAERKRRGTKNDVTKWISYSTIYAADDADICMCVPESRVVNIHVQVVVIDVHCQLKALKISEQMRD